MTDEYVRQNIVGSADAIGNGCGEGLRSKVGSLVGSLGVPECEWVFDARGSCD